MVKQAVFPCRITEECRQRLCVFLTVLLVLGILSGATLIGAAVYIRLRIRSKVKLIEGYNFDLLPITLFVIGAVTMLFDIISIRITREISYADQREKLQYVMLAMVVILTIVDIGLLVAGCMAFIDVHLLTRSFHNGLDSAMRKYKDDIDLKAEIDSVQMDFGCCGNNGYEDWFNIQWINNEYLNQESNDVVSKSATGEYLNDDTPFSCCHPQSVRPCIHHNILDNEAHYRYNFDVSYTIHKTGCKQKLMEYFSKRLSNIGSVIMGYFSLQLVAVIAAQYLNSSICNALGRGNPERTAKGWIFEECPLVTVIKYIGGMLLG